MIFHVEVSGLKTTTIFCQNLLTYLGVASSCLETCPPGLSCLLLCFFLLYEPEKPGPISKNFKTKMLAWRPFRESLDSASLFRGQGWHCGFRCAARLRASVEGDHDMKLSAHVAHVQRMFQRHAFL